jgi:IstB-like ATP binding protein
MTVATIDRLVHHAVILEINADSYRRKAAISRLEEQAAKKTVTDPKTKNLIVAPATIKSATIKSCLHALLLARSKRLRGDRQTGHPSCR